MVSILPLNWINENRSKHFSLPSLLLPLGSRHKSTYLVTTKQMIRVKFGLMQSEIAPPQTKDVFVVRTIFTLKLYTPFPFLFAVLPNLFSVLTRLPS